jgi:hypothetical protein
VVVTLAVFLLIGLGFAACTSLSNSFNGLYS